MLLSYEYKMSDINLVTASVVERPGLDFHMKYHLSCKMYIICDAPFSRVFWPALCFGFSEKMTRFISISSVGL